MNVTESSLIAGRRVVGKTAGQSSQESYLQVVARAAADSLECLLGRPETTARSLSEDAVVRVRSELAHVARLMSLGVLAASIAHEVSQPLSGIVTNASTCLRMLATDPPDIDGARETARRMVRDGERASAVITSLRVLFAKKDGVVGLVDLNDSGRQVISLLRTELQRNHVLVRSEFADDLPPVMADGVQLQQVMLNLLLNAVEAMRAVEGRPRQLVVTTEHDAEDQVRFSVRDAGVGFDARAEERLFEPFYTTKSEGMGIGLAVSRSIVEGHHGRLWATLNDGPGATFSFSVPSARPPTSAKNGVRGFAPLEPASMTQAEQIKAL